MSVLYVTDAQFKLYKLKKENAVFEICILVCVSSFIWRIITLWELNHEVLLQEQ